jgi:4-amino-4-deoxy-L-arabinose transferase-like glycosyltransferase
MTPRRLLLSVLLLALLVRVWGIGFGIPYVNARPDETQIAGPAVGFLSGDLRPPLLEWPTLFPYSVAATYVLYYAATKPFAAYKTLEDFSESRRRNIAPFIYITRALAVMMGVLTVWGVYCVTSLVFDGTIALGAALFLALSFLHVRDSHFGVTDIPMTAMVVLAVAAIERWRRAGGLARAAIAGLLAGLATSTKYNGLGVAVPFAVAAGLRLFENREQPRAFVTAAASLAVFGGTLALALFATSPYILIDWSRFVRSVSATQAMIAAGHGMVIGRGWWYYAQVVLPAAVGWPIFVAGTLGIAAALLTKFRETATLFAFPIAYYLIAGRGYGVFARYILPVIPFLCIGAAWLVVEAVRLLTRSSSSSIRRLALVGTLVVVVAPTAYKTFLLDRLLGTTDNRTVTGRALVEMLPPGSVFYQSGEAYGHVPLGMDGREASVRVARFDATTAMFAPADPDWILVQRSPLVLYSAVPPALEQLLKERYTLARQFPTETRANAARVYDQQDAFYLPIEGLEGLTRPGPSFELYSRRKD